MARIFLLKFEVDGARYRCCCEDDINMDIQFGLNMEWIQLAQDRLQATPVVIHSFSNLSDDRSKASSKTVPPHSAI